MKKTETLKKALLYALGGLILLRLVLGFLNNALGLEIFLFAKGQLLFELLIYALMAIDATVLTFVVSKDKKSRITALIACFAVVCLMAGIYANYISKTNFYYDKSPFSERKLIIIENAKEISFYTFDKGVFTKYTGNRFTTDTEYLLRDYEHGIYWLNNDNILLTYGKDNKMAQIRLDK